jgi:hypothetical protein
VLNLPSDLHQTSQRPVRANHVDLDVAPIACDDIVQVLIECERQSGEVIHRIVLAAFGRSSRRSPFRTPSPPETVSEARSVRRGRDGRA